jgi:hypothetical protein
VTTDVVGLTTARKTARAALVGGWFDGGSLKFYTAPRPASNGGAITEQTLLNSTPMATPAGSASSGAWTCSPLPSATMNVATGTAAWARGFASDDSIIGDFDVGIADSPAPAIVLDNASLVQGAELEILSFVLTES